MQVIPPFAPVWRSVTVSTLLKTYKHANCDIFDCSEYWEQEVEDINMAMD